MQQEIKVDSDQSIFDVALFCYNDASLVYNLMIENPSITDLSMNITGLTLKYTPIKAVKYEARENGKSTNKVVTIKTSQSLFDLSLQYYGSAERVYELIQNNSYLESLLSENFNSQNLAISNEKNFVINYFNKIGKHIATMPKSTVFRLLEDGDYRITEDGNRRILE